MAINSGKSPKSSPPAAHRAALSAAAKARAAKTAKAINACYARKPASGDLYVRTAEPGLQAQAQEIGGGWAWDYTTGSCLNSLNWTIASAGTADGECTTVGYKADNPGYDPNAVPAARLKNVADEAGPGC